MQVNVDDMLDLAKKEKGLYENLLALVEEEMKYAREGNASALMDVLRRKQEIYIPPGDIVGEVARAGIYNGR